MNKAQKVCLNPDSEIRVMFKNGDDEYHAQPVVIPNRKWFKLGGALAGIVAVVAGAIQGAESYLSGTPADVLSIVETSTGFMNLRMDTLEDKVENTEKKIENLTHEQRVNSEAIIRIQEQTRDLPNKLDAILREVQQQ